MIDFELYKQKYYDFYKDIEDLVFDVYKSCDNLCFYDILDEKLFIKQKIDYISNIYNGIKIFNYIPALKTLKYFIECLYRAGYICFGYRLTEIYVILQLHKLSLYNVLDESLYKDFLTEGFMIEHCIYLMNQSNSYAEYFNRCANQSFNIFTGDIPLEIIHTECAKLKNTYIFVTERDNWMSTFYKHLSPLNNKIIPIYIKNLLIDVNLLRLMSTQPTFNKGMNYFKNSKVFKIALNDGCLSGNVNGQNGNIYNTTVKIQNGNILEHKCTCLAHLDKPYKPCKHIVALCLTHNQNIENFSISNDRD